MGRIVILDPTATPPERANWSAPTLGRPVRGLTVGLRLDRSWRCYDIVVDTWTELLRADGAHPERLVIDARVGSPGAQTPADLDAWSQLVDCAVVGLGN